MVLAVCAGWISNSLMSTHHFCVHHSVLLRARQNQTKNAQTSSSLVILCLIQWSEVVQVYTKELEGEKKKSH